MQGAYADFKRYGRSLVAFSLPFDHQVERIGSARLGKEELRKLFSERPAITRVRSISVAMMCFSGLTCFRAAIST